MGMFVVAPSPFHHHHHESLISDSHPLNPATALGVGVIPLLTASPCLENENILNLNTRRNHNHNHNQNQQGIQFWHEPQPQQHQHHQQHNSHSHYLKKQGFLDHHNTSPTNLVQHCGGGGGGGGGLTVSGTSSGGGTTTCQDCGNQAKKDCSNRRCRTCCKSRGFDCPTHVKSTWVPAARRRERLASATTTTVVAGGGSSGSTSGAKKPRLIASQTTSHTSTSNTTPPRSFDTTSSHQDAGFKESMPGQVRAPAVFKCVRVTSVDDGKDEYAYQAVVKINGHVFKGFLYDHGVENREVYPNLSELHLGGGSGNSGGANRNVGSSSPMLHPSHDVYAAASSGGLLGNSGYGGNQIN